MVSSFLGDEREREQRVLVWEEREREEKRDDVFL